MRSPPLRYYLERVLQVFRTGPLSFSLKRHENRVCSANLGEEFAGPEKVGLGLPKFCRTFGFYRTFLQLAFYNVQLPQNLPAEPQRFRRILLGGGRGGARTCLLRTGFFSYQIHVKNPSERDFRTTHRQGSIEPFASKPPPFLGYSLRTLPKVGKVGRKIENGLRPDMGKKWPQNSKASLVGLFGGAVFRHGRSARKQPIGLNGAVSPP